MNEQEIYDFFGEKNYWLFDEKKAKIKGNLYDKYFEGTCSLINYKSELIIDIIGKNNKVIGRKYMKNKDEVGYYEIFEEPKSKLINLYVSKNISFLFSPKTVKNTDQYEFNERIGFRFYDDINNLNSLYFTLVRKYDNRYYVLEINEKENKSEEYLKIIKKIIYQKYLEGNFPNGDSIIEILGYCYILMNIKFENMVFVEPFIPSLNVPDSLRDPSPNEFINDMTYIIPIIYSNHISLILTGKFVNPNNKTIERCNIIIDMSKAHTIDNKLDKFFFPPCFSKNLKLFPNSEIQKYPSCSLWFLGETEIISKQNGIVFFTIFKKLNNNNSFILEVTNIINKNIGLKNNVIELTNDYKLIEYHKIIYSFLGILYKIDEDIILNYVLDLRLLFTFDNININMKEINFILDAQDIIEQARNLITNLKSNKSYIKIVEKNVEEQDLIIYDEAINIIKLFIEKFYSNYSKNFSIIYKQMYKQMLSYKNSFKEILDDTIDYNLIINSEKELHEIKKKYIQLFHYDEKTINDLLNESGDILLTKLYY